jgi:5-methylcytosine-specific restriction endonuclease McrA
MYLAQQVCQKHYFRMMRNGCYEKKLTRLHRPRGRKYRLSNPAGYQKLDIPEHPLADSSGYVYEHRFIVYERYGEILPDCELCGNTTEWDTCHIDHKDNDVTNNTLENLRPVCAPCNTNRGTLKGVEHWNAMPITLNGVTLTPHEWGKRDDVAVCGATIRRRLQQGWSIVDAVYGKKITHNGNKPKKPLPKTSCKSERSNSVTATINGVTLTATEWSRDARCVVSGATIRNRVRAGWSHDEKLITTSRRKSAHVAIKARYTKMAKDLP